MIAIRGATTINADTPENITAASLELMKEIISANSLDCGGAVCLMISTTADIKSFYPARAVREAGYNMPLYSSLEPEIDGSLKLCIRFMLLAEKGLKKPKHVYLHRAKNLRKDISVINIALDGPAGSGKSTVAKLVAEKLSIFYLDTGAMYRAAAYFMLREKVDITSDENITLAAEKLEITVTHGADGQRTFLNGIDVTFEIRSPEISMAASSVSKNKTVRYKLAHMQRLFAQKSSCILDGRDIGSFVLPNADFKFYLTAEIKERAKRRFSELKAKGYKADLAAIEEDIRQRDFNDANRDTAPLVKTDDAVLINTTNMTAEDAALTIVKIIGA